jgi:hypothetical protein
MENIKWNGDKKEFLSFAKDYVVNIHERCRNPKTPEDYKLIHDVKDMEIQIIGTVKGEDVLEIRFVKKPIPTAEQWLANHQQLSHYDVAEYDEGGYLGVNEAKLYQIMIEFATMHVQACKQDIAKNANLSDELYEFISDSWEGGDYIDKQSILNAYPESNIK